MKVIIEIQSDGEEIISATVDMDEKVFFGLGYGDELEIDFDDTRTELNFCVWYKEPLTGLFGFEVSEISNSRNYWHLEKRKEPGYIDHILCIVAHISPTSDEE